MYGSKIDNLVKLNNKNINIPKFFIYNEQFSIDMLDNNKLYAIRSSSNLEDGHNDSFAGQFTTFLNIKKENILEKVKECKLSSTQDNVLIYTKKKRNNKNINMHVMIQEMIDADVSGVLFTSNPLGILNEVVISVAKGLGENVVQGQTNTTNYYYNTTDHVYYMEGKKNLLNKQNIKELLKVADDIKKILKEEFLDIEFAIKNNDIFILQARPITTIINQDPIILDNSNIVESYPNLSLPLTTSFVNHVYSSIFKHLCMRVLKSNKVMKYSKYFNNMTTNVNGRMYYQINNWYGLMKLLPFSNKLISMWQEMLGIQNKEYNSKKDNISVFEKVKICKNYYIELKNSQQNMKKLNKEFIKINDYFWEHFSYELNNKEILKLFDVIEKKVLDKWDITLINDMYAFIFTALSKKILSIRFSENDVNNYISGISNIESLKPIKTMIGLAIRKEKNNQKTFNKFKEKYIKIYGDRYIEELKLESKTFRTHPELLDQKIDEYLMDKDNLNNIYNNLKTKISKKKINKIERFLLKKCNSGIRNREISRLNRTRIYGMVRLMYLCIGNNFVNQKIINENTDIFYLTMDEIKEIIYNNKKSAKQIVKERKQKYKTYEKLPSYSRLIFDTNIFDKNITNIEISNNIDFKNIIYGIPCSSGNVSGEIMIVEDFDNIEKYRNKILVTKTTDPGWVFLISIAKGIISEKGSLLSHTAIVARELKIPFITNVSNAYNIFKNGDNVEINGNTGEIKRKDK